MRKWIITHERSLREYVFLLVILNDCPSIAEMVSINGREPFHL